MAEITARLQFEQPSSFSARDEFNQSAGALTGKTAPVGGAWSGEGDTDDFAVETTGKTVQRTAVSDTEARRAYLGDLASMTAVGVQVDLSWSALPLGNSYGVFARRHAASAAGAVAAVERAEDAVSGSERSWLVMRTNLNNEGGALARLPLDGLSNGALYTLRLVVFASGQWYVWFFPQGSQAGAPKLGGFDATYGPLGGLNDGSPGLVDLAPSPVAATRNYDNLLAFVPTADAACFANQSLEYRHDGAFRENAAGTQWAEKTVSGRNLLIPCSGAEGRTPRVIVMASRYDPDTMPHEFGDLRATLTITERYLGVPGS